MIIIPSKSIIKQRRYIMQHAGVRTKINDNMRLTVQFFWVCDGYMERKAGPFLENMQLFVNCAVLKII